MMDDPWFYTTVDPTHLHRDGKPLPAGTVLLYRVCDNDPDKFEEACRLVGLFVKTALAAKAKST
jgi:hypothetical protein